MNPPDRSNPPNDTHPSPSTPTALAPADRSPPSVQVIGIGGATRSGKSTLALALAQQLKSDVVHVSVVHGDRYWRVCPHSFDHLIWFPSRTEMHALAFTKFIYHIQ